MRLLTLNEALKAVNIFSRNVWKASDAAEWMKDCLAKRLHNPPVSSTVSRSGPVCLLSWQGACLRSVEACLDLRKVGFLRLKTFAVLRTQAPSQTGLLLSKIQSVRLPGPQRWSDRRQIAVC